MKEKAMMEKSLALLIIFCLAAGCGAQQNNTTERKKDDAMAITMKHPARKAVVLTADVFEDMELYFPVFRLQEEGWEVTIAAPTMNFIRGEHGYGVEPDTTIDAINPDEYDLLLIPGGSPDGAPSTVRKIPKAQAIARSFFEKNKPVAAICHGPYTLISAGLVKGRHLTSYWHDGVPEEIKKAGGIWEDKDVVVDGNLVSSRWPMDLPAFMREVIHLTNGKK